MARLGMARAGLTGPSLAILGMACLCWHLSGCATRATPPLPPSHVQNGQLYQSGQSEFDGLFRELHDLQLALASAPEEERQFRKSLAASIAIDDGITRNLIADQVATKTLALVAKKIRVKLDVEGLEADDETDTMAQAKVIGTLDEPSQKFIEATALAARQELRFAARLRRAQKRLEHLANHASALEPWLDATFGGQGQTKTAEVRHNLDDARRQFPLLTVRAAELAEEARRTVQRLVTAMTNDASIGSNREPPLIAPADPPATQKRPRPATQTTPTAKKPAPAAKPPDTGGADFEP